MNLYYNPNNRVLPIYATKAAALKESGNTIGALYTKECCVLVSIENGSCEERAGKIEFVNPSGVWSTGYITWNGSNLTSWSERPNALVNGNPRYKVVKTTTIYNGSKGKVAVLNPGDYVYTRPGPAYVGASEHDWMRCFAYKKNGAYKEPGNTLFVDTQVKHGSMSPHVRGNW